MGKPPWQRNLQKILANHSILCIVAIACRYMGVLPEDLRLWHALCWRWVTGISCWKVISTGCFRKLPKIICC